MIGTEKTTKEKKELGNALRQLITKEAQDYLDNQTSLVGYDF